MDQRQFQNYSVIPVCLKWTDMHLTIKMEKICTDPDSRLPCSGTFSSALQNALNLLTEIHTADRTIEQQTEGTANGPV